MVESKRETENFANYPATHGYFKVLVMLRGVFQVILLPFLSKRQIKRFARLNKKC